MRNLMLAVMLIAAIAGTRAGWGFGGSISYYTVDQCTAQARICHPKGAKGPKDFNMDACMNVCKDCTEHFGALDQAMAGGKSGEVAKFCQKIEQFNAPCVREAQACTMSLQRSKGVPKTKEGKRECDLFCNTCRNEFGRLQKKMLRGHSPPQGTPNIFEGLCQRIGMGPAPAPGSVGACTNEFIKCSQAVNSFRKENPGVFRFPVDSPPFAHCKNFCHTSDPAPATGNCDDEKKMSVAQTVGFPPGPQGLNMINAFCKNLFTVHPAQPGF